ncbi:MAG: helix-turn-helix domain-containing protein [Salinivirgaceae bacterium]|nr:helix-turn-helix domain-containing protein [Salinivirgaceae bacterium]
MNKQTIFMMIPQQDIEEMRSVLKDIQVKLQNGKTKQNIVLGDFISEKEARELINRKTTWFWQKRKSGELTGKKAGNQWFYKREDIIRFIERGIT